MSTKIQFKRLIKLAEHLEKLKPTKTKVFDMITFRTDTIDTNGNVCKTAACALGEACTIPSFKKAGLKFKLYYKEDCNPITIYYSIIYNKPNTNTSFDAASKFFGISLDTAYEFFDPDYYPKWSYINRKNYKITPKQVAKKIRKFIKEELAKKGK